MRVIWLQESEMLSGTIQVQTSIMQRRASVVMQETFFPDTPRLCILQFWNGSVEKSYWCARLVVLGHPVNSVVDTILGSIQKTFTQRILKGCFQNYLMRIIDFIPVVY